MPPGNDQGKVKLKHDKNVPLFELKTKQVYTLLIAHTLFLMVSGLHIPHIEHYYISILPVAHKLGYSVADRSRCIFDG